MVTTVAELSERLATWLERLMPEQPRRAGLLAALRDEHGGDDAPLTAAGCAAIEATAQRFSRHLMLLHDAAGTSPPDEEAHGWPPDDPEDVRRRSGAVVRVERTVDHVAVLRIDALEALPFAEPFLRSAFRLAAGARKVVLDLRHNGGGDPATVAQLAGWVLGGEAQHLSDVHYRDRVRQWWTPGGADDCRLPADCPVDVLTSSSTFSSAEALTYHLRARGRVRVVGEPGRGGADHVTPVRLDPTVLGLLPEAYVVDAVTGSSWEATGVPPDVPCPAEDALVRALAD